jgi:hypothetical protein
LLHPSNDNSSDTQADSANACIDPEQPPAQTRICGTPHLDNQLAGKPINNKYFDIFDQEIDLWFQFSTQKEYRLAHWCVKQNICRAAVNEIVRNTTMAAVRNFTSSHILFKRLNEMSYPMGINWWKSGKVRCNRLANPNNFAAMITHILFTPILLNVLSSACISQHSGNISHMLQQSNSMMLRNSSTQR